MDYAMKLPDLRYDCLCCGKGCEINWTILVNQKTEATIADGPAVKAVKQQGFVPIQELEPGLKVIGRKENGHCVFLREDKLCSIHAEQSFEAKPRPCRQFPFHPINTPDGYYIGLSFLCSAVQRNHGRPLEEQTEEIAEAVHQLSLEYPPSQLTDLAIPVGPEVTTSWSEFLKLEKAVQGHLKQEPLLESLWRATSEVGMAFLSHLESGTPFVASSIGTVQAPPLSLVMPSLESVAAALISVAEAPGGGQQRRAVAEGYALAEPFHSVRAGRTMVYRPEAPVSSWFDAEVRRYFEHVIFRKFLGHGPVVGRTFALCCLYQVLRFYTLDSAAQAGRAEPLKEDYYQALDVVEAELMLHADGLNQAYDHLQFTALELLDPV